MPCVGAECRSVEQSCGEGTGACSRRHLLRKCAGTGRMLCARWVCSAGASGVPVHPHTGGSGRPDRKRGVWVPEWTPGVAFVPARGHVLACLSLCLSCCPAVRLSRRVRVGDVSFRVPCACPLRVPYSVYVPSGIFPCPAFVASPPRGRAASCRCGERALALGLAEPGRAGRPRPPGRGSAARRRPAARAPART